nr:GNAT family N-acetyltransferase [Angustibacter aerolatus]
MSEPQPLTASGERVHVRPVLASDAEPYRRAVLASRERLSRWNPVDPDDLLRHVERQSDVHRTFLVLAHEPRGAHGVVGRINLSSIVRGRFESGSLGYDAYDPYAGTGLFREGLSLVVDVALRPRLAGGVGLHRVEANVQPGNASSAGLLRSLGFRHEGRTPRMLLLAGADGRDDWRDHERYAITAEEWPAEPYAPPAERAKVVALVEPERGGTALAPRLAAEPGAAAAQRAGRAERAGRRAASRRPGRPARGGRGAAAAVCAGSPPARGRGRRGPVAAGRERRRPPGPGRCRRRPGPRRPGAVRAGRRRGAARVRHGGAGSRRRAAARAADHAGRAHRARRRPRCDPREVTATR